MKARKGKLRESSLEINELIYTKENWNIKTDDNSVLERSEDIYNYAKEIWPLDIMEKVVVGEEGLNFDEVSQIIIDTEKMTIVEALKIVAFRRYPEALTLEEMKDDIIELYDYVTEGEFEIDITFSREKISTGGWMTERLNNNQINKENKSDRYEKPIFIKDEERNVWTIGEDIYELMGNS